MKIAIGRHAGFCAGVESAFKMVHFLKMENLRQPVFILGSLVHNEEVNRKIFQKGIERIDREFFLRSDSKKIGTLIITAHGVGPDIYEMAEKKGINVVDTTCPKVVKVQRLANFYAKKGFKIVIIGDKRHKEVLGIKKWSGGPAKIISNKKDLAKINFSVNEKIALLSQTTQEKDFFDFCAKYLKKRYPYLKVVSTICLTTYERQKEIKKIAKSNEIILVVGSRESANTNRLFKISRSINSRTYFIGKAQEIKEIWLKGVKKVALAAGASTPPWIIKEIADSLKKRLDFS